MQMNKILCIVLLSLLTPCVAEPAAWTTQGATRAVAIDALDSPSYPMTMGVFGRCINVTGGGYFMGISDTTSNGIYYGVGCVTGASGYYLMVARNPTQVLTTTTGLASVVNDEVPDSLVMVMAENNDRALYVNGTLEASSVTAVNMSSASKDISLLGLRRLDGAIGNWAGVINHAWVCQREFTAEEVEEYHNNIYDKDYIRQLCAREPGAQFIFYPMTDMVVLSPYQLGAHPAYKHSDGYGIKDVGGGFHNAVLEGIGEGTKTTGTFDLQN